MQGRFKAAQITNDNLLIHILRYIHLNPVSSNLIPGINTYYPWSSYSDYSEQETNLACSKDEILSYFKSLEDFEKFHKDQEDYAKELEKIKHLAID